MSKCPAVIFNLPSSIIAVSSGEDARSRAAWIRAFARMVALQVRAGLLDGKLDMREERADLSWNRCFLNHSRDRSAPAMAQHEDRIGPQHGGSILETGEDLRSYDVSRYAGYEELSDGLVKDHLNRHARIGTGKNRGKRLLLLQRLLQHGKITPVGGRAPAGEPAIAREQLLQCRLGAESIPGLRRCDDRLRLSDHSSHLRLRERTCLHPIPFLRLRYPCQGRSRIAFQGAFPR
jgi:hypothetical protein